MVNWECDGNANYDFCDMCPLYITTDICLEDTSNPAGGTNFDFLPASYDFTSAKSTGLREYIVNQQTPVNAYWLFTGFAPPFIKYEEFEAGRSESHGYYFNGITFMEHTRTAELTFDDMFTVEMWIKPDMTYGTDYQILWSKRDTFGFDRAELSFYFNA